MTKKQKISLLVSVVVISIISATTFILMRHNESSNINTTNKDSIKENTVKTKQTEENLSDNDDFEKTEESENKSNKEPAKPIDNTSPAPTTAPTPPSTTAAPPPNQQPPAQPQPAPKILFSGDFETGSLSQWYNNQSCPGAITIVNNPVRSGRYAAKFTVNDTDTSANCPKSPTLDPRAQLIAGHQLADGDEFYASISTFFPSDFPNITTWLGIAQIYGPPYGGSPTMGMGVNGDRIQFTARYDGRHHTLWSSQPIQKGAQWHDIVLHIKLSPDRSIGFVEIWSNGVKQTLVNGSTRYNYPTLVEGANWTGPGGYNYLYIQQYRSREALLGAVTLYHDNAKIGTTYESVAP